MAQIINLAERAGWAPPVGSFACETSGEWQVIGQDLHQHVGFCDWVSVYQRFTFPVPKMADGAVMFINDDGTVEHVTLRRAAFEGSHASTVMIRSDGETVEFSGNVSKFNRPDNVFGLSFLSCLRKINGIMVKAGFPEFSEGTRYVTSENGHPKVRWTGAKITRLDITQNYACGSREDALHFMRWLEGQQASRLKTGTFGDGETVDFGRHSRSDYFKVYYKPTQLLKFSPKGDEYIAKLAQWLESVGTIRAELTLKSRKLADLGCSYLGGLNMRVIEGHFAKRQEVFTRASAEVDELPKVKGAVLGTLRMWENGDDVAGRLSKATFYRHRAALLEHGIDIAIRSNVQRLQQRTRVIQLSPVPVPDWYQLEETGT